MAPMARLLVQSLLIRLEKASAGAALSPALLEEHVAHPRHARSMLLAASAASDEPRVCVFLSRVASGAVRSCSDVQRIAQEMRISVPYLSRLVYRETRVSVQRHVDVRRLLDAAHLLSKTFLPIDEIAARVGYEHRQHLDRCFDRDLCARPIELRIHSLRETCRVYMRGRHDALFARWVSQRLPTLAALGDGPGWLRQLDSVLRLGRNHSVRRSGPVAS
jgi:transcriptional regulator GlxA family with amidase domain